ncbi:MAG TPA: ABC transporter ATP-binding protein [Opitutaceae bacterium]|nr:ABC transporter ATP-binding protein [Opitutaceae bacterium]
MSATVELRGVTKHFGPVAAVDDVTLVVRPGEFVTLLGPSGCGKTTLLRLIAGFETPDAGEVRLDGEDVTRLPPYRRNVNQVFQSYALFPHLTVRENIGFGLRMQRLPPAQAKARIEEAVALVSLGGLEDRRPHQLSGGQRQRVALARALAPRPAVLLLDEPLSALDAQLRHGMQLELKRLQRQLGTTFIFVTHDQEEALTMSDRIALINRGRIEQLGEVHEIYHRPATPFAAEFIGQANLLEARLESRGGDVAVVRLEDGLALPLPMGVWPANVERALVSIRPEKIHVSRTPVSNGEAFPGRVVEEVFKGATDRLVIASDAGTRLVAVVANASAFRDPIHEGDRVWCAIHPDDVAILTAT